MTVIETIPITTDPDLDEDEPKVAHIVRKEDQMRGYIEGAPIEALCGKVWVPSRDPERLPVCQRCVEIKDQIINARKGNN